jgi:DNA repair protein SbcD/Mre11
MIKIIHTADIHFGMENYGKIDQQTGIHTRLLDFKKALDFCIDFCIKEKVDLFVFSGDAYKTANPSPTQQKLLMECFFRLYKNNIPVVIVVGNHDTSLSFGKATALDVFGNLPIDGFHVINKPESLLINSKNGPIQVVAIPWPSRTNLTISEKFIYKSATEIVDAISKKVSQIISDFANRLNPEIPSILCGHLTVSSGVFSGSEKRAVYGNDPLFLPSQLAIQPFDYVALGHLHRYQNLNKNGYPAIVYSGSVERVDFGERKEDKGFCLIKIPEKNRATHEFIKTPTRPFLQIEVNINEELDPTQQIIEEIKKYNIEDAVVKILYHLPNTIKDSVNLKKIQQECSKAIHLVGIIPIREQGQRNPRTETRVEMSLEELLNDYFNSKPELKKSKSRLIEKTLQLQNDLLDTIS